MTDNPLTDRIDALEMRVAFQDQTIEDLNEAIGAQWKQLDHLARQLAKLTEELAEAEANAGRPTAPEPPPPHY